MAAHGRHDRRSAAYSKAGPSLIPWIAKWIPLVIALWFMLSWGTRYHLFATVIDGHAAAEVARAYAEAESAAWAAAQAEDDAGASSEVDDAHAAPLKVYLYPLPAAFNFAMLQPQWNVGCRLDVLATHGVPHSWNFNGTGGAASSSSTSSSAISTSSSSSSTASSSGLGGSHAFADSLPSLPSLYETDLLAGMGGWTHDAVTVQLPCYHSFPYFWQHSSEYYLTLSLLFGLSSVSRVEDPTHADIVFLPYFATLACREKRSPTLHPLILSLLDRLSTHPLLLPASYPLAFLNQSSQLRAARKMAVDLDAYPMEDADPLIDLVVPYAPLLPPFSNDKGQWEERDTLLFFRGTKNRNEEGPHVRSSLFLLLSGRPGVVFDEAQASSEASIMGAAGGLRRAKYCLSPEGDTSSSCRLFDSIVSGCVPVVVSDAIELPFEDKIDYSAFALFVPTALALRPNHLLLLLNGQTRQQWEQRWANMRKVQKHFLFSSPSERGGAEDMVWRAVRRRLGNRRPSQRHRRQRMRLLLRQLAGHGLNASALQQPMNVRPMPRL